MLYNETNAKNAAYDVLGTRKCSGAHPIDLIVGHGSIVSERKHGAYWAI